MRRWGFAAVCFWLSACGGKEAPVGPGVESVVQTGSPTGWAVGAGSGYLGATGASSGTANPGTGASTATASASGTGASSGVVMPGGSTAFGSCVRAVQTSGFGGIPAATPKATAGETLLVLAANQTLPYNLAVDDAYVYWAAQGDGTITKVPLGGGNAVMLTSRQEAPGGIAVDATSVYWSSAGGAWKLPKSGGIPTLLASGVIDDTIAVGPTGVYATEPGDVLIRVPLDGLASFPLDVPGSGGTYGIALDASYVYWSSMGASAIRKVPLLGGAATTLAMGQGTLGIAVDGKSVYWANGADATVRSVPVGGGNSTVLISGLSQGPTSIALDEASVYVTTGYGSPNCGMVIKAPLGGGPPKALVTGLAGPWGIAVDATSVYFTDITDSGRKGEDSVMKVTPK